MENKINIARFKEGSRTAEVKGSWQWDYGQILRIQGLNLPTAVEIHFSLDEHGGEAARRIGVTKDGVTDVPIPDSMVENESAYGDSYYFFAYIYLSDEESGNTEYKIRAKVSTRSRPEGYVSSGNDTFAEILKTVNGIAEDKVDIPASAKVGQVLSVKATDESGKPTEFEATDPGGGVSDEKIAEAVNAYLEEHPLDETDPTVPDWAKQPEKPSYTALEVGADAAGTAESKVSEHNTSEASHNDIRVLLQGLANRLNALADSDDTTLDQMSEVVAYVKSNKSLIDAITTSKVNVSDIIDNLITNVSNKPLSAAQGVKLKALIDAITAVELDESLSDNTKAAPAGVVGELKSDLSQLSEEMENLKSTGTGTGMELEDGTVTFKKLQSITYNGESTTESLVVNLFNKNAIEYGSVEPAGTLTRNGNTNYERIEIAIEGGKKYTMSAIVDDTNKLPSMYMAMLDYDKNILFYGLSYGKDWRSPSDTTTTSSEMTGKEDATGKGIILSTTADCAYFRFMTKKAEEYDITDVFMFEEGEICHDYVDYVSGENPDDIQTLDGCEITKIFGANLADTKARNNIISLENSMNALLKQVGFYSGKKWAVLGDSVSYYTAYANNKLYHQVIGSDLGFEVINLSERNRGFSAGGESNFLNGQVPNIPEDVDLITIMGSINDASLASNLGEVTDTGTDTYCGIIYNTLMTIIKDHPNAALGVMTDNPIVGNENHSKVCGAIESVCNHCGVPCLNLNKISGIYPNIDEAKAIQMHDDVHPNEVGHALMAAKIKPWIKTLL